MLRQCIYPHPVRKQIAVRALCRIKDDALAEDLDKFNVDQGCVDVDIMIEQYKYLSNMLDKHAPKKNIYVVDMPLNEWMTDNILALNAFCRKNGLIRWQTRTTIINFDIYCDRCKAVEKSISKRKSQLMEQRVINCEGDQKIMVFSHIFSTWE